MTYIVLLALAAGAIVGSLSTIATGALVASSIRRKTVKPRPMLGQIYDLRGVGLVEITGLDFSNQAKRFGNHIDLVNYEMITPRPGRIKSTKGELIDVFLEAATLVEDVELRLASDAAERIARQRLEALAKTPPKSTIEN